MSGDAQVLIGYSNIINGANVKQGANVFEIEEQLVNGGLVSKTADTADRFSDEIKDLANKYGINFGDLSGGSGGSSGSSGGSSGGGSVSISPPRPVERTQSPPQYEDISYDDSSYDDNDTKYHNEDPPTPSIFARKDTTELYKRTQEQERRSHISSVIGSYHENDFSFENEKKEDEKCVMLEEIESLIYSLQNEDVDLSRTPKVDENSSYEDIERVLKILRHKIDRTRYCNLAEEFLIWGAYGMEELFDGKRVWLGRYQPCLVGWHTQVQCKLRRMRYDTSQIMSSVMHDFNIGPGLRVLLELIPNMFIYSREMKQQQPGRLYSEDEVTAATNRIRDM